MESQTNSTRVKAPANSRCHRSSVSRNQTTHDVSALNPTGRVNTDNCTSKTSHRLLSCKRAFSISTFNTRTLRKENHLDEIFYSAEEHNLGIVAIQEHRHVHEEEVIKQWNHTPNHTLFTSSALKNQAGAAIHGIGLLMRKDLKDCVEQIESITPRIMVATFAGNPVTTVIACYSPTNVSPEEEVAEFYSDLSEVISEIPPHNQVYICGDFNAKLGSDNVRNCFHEETNRNGEYLFNMLETFDLVAANTIFEKPSRKMWTFKYPNGCKAQLDYILVRKKWARSVKNCEPFSTTCVPINSDHRCLTAVVKLSLRAPKKETSSRAINFKSLASSKELKEEFVLKVHNRFSSLLTEGGEDLNFQQKYNLLSDACTEVGKSTLPKKPKKNWSNISKTEEVVKARNNLKEARTKGNKTQCKDAHEALLNAYKDEETKYIEEQTRRIEEASHSERHALAWKIINEVSGRKESTGLGKPKGTVEERKEVWLSHFKNLLGKPPTVSEESFEVNPVIDHDLPIETGPFVMKELKDVIKSSKRGGAIGIDAIPLEVWESEEFLPYLLQLTNNTQLHKEKPSQWSQSILIPIPKKGTSIPPNVRGISLNPIAAKIYNKMLLNRIQPHVDPLLTWTQNGFRKSRSTLFNIITLRRIIEGLKAKHLPLATVFIDFSKAFDSIHRERMFKILRAYGIPSSTVEAIKIIYDNSSAKVITPDGETDFFEIIAGIFQGDTLAPYLFIIVLDYVLKEAYKVSSNDTGVVIEPRRGKRQSEIKLRDSSYADDIALLNHSLELAEELLHAVERAAMAVGLHLNAGKTEVLSINIHVTHQIKTLQGKPLKNVNNFKYLGSYTPSSEYDFKIRRALAWVACNKLEKIWRSSLKRKLKIRFFRACVESVLLYGSETWTITAKMKANINGTYTRLLRRALNVSWKDHMTNAELYGKIPLLSNTIKRRRLRFAGHCIRAENQPAANLLFWTPTEGKAKRGAPTKTFCTMLQEDTGLKDNREIRTVMKDRKNWTKFCDSVVSSTDDR